MRNLTVAFFIGVIWILGGLTMASNERLTFTISANDAATPAFKKLNTELLKTQKRSKEMQGNSGAMGSLKGLGDNIQALGTAFAGFKIIQYAGQLNALGVEARGTGLIFQNLATDFGGANQLLSQLRETTGKVVDDMTLQSGANQMMKMGLADSADEMNRLMELAIKLKKPTDSATDAIDNFSMMLANNSVLRLDSFGMSSGKAKTRMDELLASGEALNRSEAFKMTVLEQGADTLERLGDAADVSETSMNRLGTRLDNLITKLADVTSAAFEAGAQLAEMFIIAVESPAEFGEALETAVDHEIETSMLGRAFELQMEAERLKMGLPPMLGETSTAMNIQPGISSTSTGTFAFDLAASQQAIAQQQTDLSYGQFGGVYSDIQSSSYLGQGNLGWMQPDSINEAINGYEKLKLLAEDLKEDPFIREVQVERMDAMLEGAKGIAEQAERAKEAFDNMSLSGMLGQTSGGRLGEAGDMFLGGFEEGDTRDKFKEAMDRKSGRTTDLSSAFENEFTPLIADIAEQYGEDVAVSAAEGILKAVESGQQAGLSEQEILENARRDAGFAQTGGGGSGIEIMPGDNNYTLAGRYGGKWQDYNYLRDDNGYLQPGSYAGGGGGGLIGTGVAPPMNEMGMYGGGGQGTDLTQTLSDSQGILTEMDTSVQTISGNLDVMSMDRFNSTVYDGIELTDELGGMLDEVAGKDYSGQINIRVKLVYDSPEAKKLLQDDMTEIVNNNGGSQPE